MILEVKNLYKKFGSVVAANNINFNMKKGEIIGIIGSNGAGKTTFCNMITGYTKSDSGEIYLNKKNITNNSVQDIKSLGMHRSFQIPQVFENLSVLENYRTLPQHILQDNNTCRVQKKLTPSSLALIVQAQLNHYKKIGK